MPRSTTERLSQRLRVLIAEARVACGQPNNSPAIVHQIMIDTSDLDEDVIEHLVAIGLNKEVREYLKQLEKDTERLTTAQADLWPRSLRTYIVDIDRARVFVPSRGDFVDLVPDKISPLEIREAGRYLIAHGEDSIRRGNLLLRLADLATPAA